MLFSIVLLTLKKTSNDYNYLKWKFSTNNCCLFKDNSNISRYP